MAEKVMKDKEDDLHIFNAKNFSYSLLNLDL